MNNINLKITLDETNLILAALGQQPYLQVYQLIEKIQQQAQAQLNENGSEEVGENNLQHGEKQ